mmetsp:Transcript_13707/g.18568  ORF Transcript_13707/g.18568 Transcript_13707/m.18568 type:complete len:158 (+) Transcript_13707:158-631(+)
MSSRERVVQAMDCTHFSGEVGRQRALTAADGTASGGREVGYEGRHVARLRHVESLSKEHADTEPEEANGALRGKLVAGYRSSGHARAFQLQGDRTARAAAAQGGFHRIGGSGACRYADGTLQLSMDILVFCATARKAHTASMVAVGEVLSNGRRSWP